MTFKLKLIFKLTLLLLLFNIAEVKAQRDSTQRPLKRNLLYLEIAGNNFIGEGSGGAFTYAGINYGYKFRFVIISGGLGVVSQYRNFFKGVSVTPGLLVRAGKYKQTGLWLNLSGSIAFGKWQYSDFQGHQIYHNVDYNLSPGICFQYQNDPETFLFRAFLGTKFYSFMFNKDTYPPQYYSIPFIWGGLSFGYGF